jgi:hypothetical protein
VMPVELRPGRKDSPQVPASSSHMYMMMPVQVRASKCVLGGHGCQKKG